MLNEKRVILMTRLAAYEQGEGKKNVAIGNYFRSDYLTINILKAFVCATIAYLIVFGLYVLYNFEVFMQDLYKIDLVVLAKSVLKYYVITVAAYVILTYVFCTYRYLKARKNLKAYYQNLKKLNSLYGVDGESTGKSGKRGGGKGRR
ncbi:MAG: hypothetical protein MJ114_00105 [Acetatifactor sp.]|nr:hypothetical protein [Acetatifactor sp.]